MGMEPIDGAPADEEHGDRPATRRAATSPATSPARLERRPRCSSPIEVQFAIAPGTALVQKRHGGDGITIVIGGDAGTAEGDFAIVPGLEHPAGQRAAGLMIVTNNGWGISTAVRPARREADHRPRQGLRHPERGRRRQRSRVASWHASSHEAMDYVPQPSASRTCSRRWCRGCTATRRRAARTSVKDEVDCLAAVRAEAARPRERRSTPRGRWTQVARAAGHAGASARHGAQSRPRGRRRRPRRCERDHAANHIYFARGALYRMATLVQADPPGAARTARRTSASPTSSARTSARRSAASSPATQGLKTAWNTPLDERGIIGTAMGIAIRRRPAGRRDPVLRLRLQHHRPAQGGRQPPLGERRRLGPAAWC